MSLRHVSAALQQAGGNALWGRYWLWEDSLQWLTIMGSDREAVIREAALSIIADLIGSHEGALLVHVCARV